MRDFRGLRVWHLAHQLSLIVVRVFRMRDPPGLKAQACRAAISVSSNIAEGSARRSPAEMVRFLEIALGSICELESQAVFAKDAGAISAHDYAEISKRSELVRKMLIALIGRMTEQVGPNRTPRDGGTATVQ